MRLHITKQAAAVVEDKDEVTVTKRIALPISDQAQLLPRQKASEATDVASSTKQFCVLLRM